MTKSSGLSLTADAGVINVEYTVTANTRRVAVAADAPADVDDAAIRNASRNSTTDEIEHSSLSSSRYYDGQCQTIGEHNYWTGYDKKKHGCGVYLKKNAGLW